MSMFGTFKDRAAPLSPEAYGRASVRVPALLSNDHHEAILAAQAAILGKDRETAFQILYENKVVCCWYCVEMPIPGKVYSRGSFGDILCERCWAYVALTYTNPTGWTGKK